MAFEKEGNFSASGHPKMWKGVAEKYRPTERFTQKNKEEKDVKKTLAGGDDHSLGNQRVKNSLKNEGDKWCGIGL